MIRIECDRCGVEDREFARTLHCDQPVIQTVNGWYPDEIHLCGYCTSKLQEWLAAGIPNF